MNKKITHIDIEIVRDIFNNLPDRKKAGAGYPREIDLSTASSIDDDAAEMLRQFKNGKDSWHANLKLNGLKELTEASAQSLARFRGGIYLNGLTSISIKVAKALAKHKNHSLHLNCLTDLPEVTQIALSKHSGSLSLNGLTNHPSV
jgi:hypothetical protein